MKLQRVFFIPDVHAPYHDKKAWAFALRVLRAFRPNRVVILGDFGDFYCTSRHTKHPSRGRDLRVEIASCNELLDRLDALCADVGVTRKDFIEGNHCNNLERFLAERAPELFGLVAVRDLFRLRARGWSHTAYKDHLTIGKLHVTHETGSSGQNAHIQARAAFESNAVIGHTHRMAVHYAGNARGDSHVGAMFGWLGDATKAEYMHKVQTRHWQHGVGIGYLEPNGTIHLQAVPFIKGKAIIDGKLITSKA